MLKRTVIVVGLVSLGSPAFLSAGGGIGQEGDVVAEALSLAATQTALEHLERSRSATAGLLAELGGIVSPSGQEHERAEFVAARMRAMGLSDVRVTDSPNAVGEISGQSGRHLVFISTLDDLATVAEHQRAAATPPRVAGDRVLGPGTNTSVTTAAMLAAAEAYLASGQQPEHTLVFAAVAQEETGLVGMRAVFEEYRDTAEAFVEILGDGHSISYGALGIHWWRIEATGPPGHTLGGGLPNVNQAIGRAADRILSLPDARRDDDTRTRINVAVLDSGTVFNHKPAHGWFSLDLRSMDAAILEQMEQHVREILSAVAEETGIELHMEPVQLTPGGQIEGMVDSELVMTAAAVSRWLGYEPTMSNAGSSNMNIAIAAGVPAIGLGGSRGGDRGTPSEWGDVNGLMRTAHHVLMLSTLLGR
jgi:acetylornithine deacetylase/succinyl-diaminopimelate desuccinylase-like protein